MSLLFAKPHMGDALFWSVTCCCRRCGFAIVNACPIFKEEDWEALDDYRCPHCGLTGGYWADDSPPSREDCAEGNEDYREGHCSFESACDLMRRGWRVARLGWTDERFLFHTEEDLLGKFHELGDSFHIPIMRLAIYEAYPSPHVRCDDAHLTEDDKAAYDWYVPIEQATFPSEADTTRENQNEQSGETVKEDVDE